MQWADAKIGPTLCRLRSLFFRKQKPFPEKVKKILIIKIVGLGSIVLMTPMIRAIRNSYPSAKIYFMTLKGNEGLCKCYAISDEVIIVRHDSFWNFSIDSIKNIIRIRKERIDIIVDAEFFSRYTALFASLCQSSFLIGFFNRNMYRGKFLDKRCYFNPYHHIKQNFMELANAFCKLYSDISITQPVVSPQARDRVKKMIEEGGISGKPIIILSPQTSNITLTIDRSWPLENFAKVGQYLLKKGYAMVITGSSDQIDRAKMLCKMCGEGAMLFAGKTTLEEFIALIEEAFCIITNDSSPLHIAASQGVPTMAFFGTDTPLLYGYSEPIHTTFFKDLPCSPCLSVFNYKKGECEFDSICLRDISYDNVISEFEKKEDLLKEEFSRRKQQHI